MARFAMRRNFSLQRGPVISLLVAGLLAGCATSELPAPIRTAMGPITTGRSVIPGTPTTILTTMDIMDPIPSFHLLSFRTGTTHTMCRHPLLYHHILEKDDIGSASQNDLLLLP